jgi:cell division protein DivIC
MPHETHKRSFARPASPERVWSKPVSRLPGWLKNKFLLSFAFFVVWMLFFDRNDFITQHHRNTEYNQLVESREYYNTKIAAEKSELEKLRFNPYTLEKYAREKYFMKRDNEDIYIISGAADQ